jgi:hypothetical protein
VTPQTLWEAWRSGYIRPAELALYVTKAWASAGADRHTALTRDQWRHLFRAAEFTRNGFRDTAPDALTLYRGSPAEHRDNWSWTERPEVAQYYVRRHGGQLWTTTASGAALLAYRSTRLLDLDEYIVDTDGLEIREHQ